MFNTAFNNRAFRCPAFEPMVPLIAAPSGGVNSSYAVGFDGTNDYLSVTSFANQPTGNAPISISCWACFTRSASSVEVVAFVGVDSTAGNARGFFLYRNASGKAVAEFGSGTGAATGATTIPVGVWVHLTAVYTGTQTVIYVNGRPDGVASFLGANLQAGRLVIGAYFATTSSFLGFAAIRADDARVYNRALTDAEVQSMYRNSSSPPTLGLVCYFPLNEGTGTTVTDSIGSLTGTLTNGPTWQTQVCPRLRSGRDTTQSWSLSLVGSSSHYVASASSPLDPSATNFTASAWVKFTAVASQQVIMSQLDGSGTGATWLELTSGAKLQTAIGGSNLTGATSLVANVWYHVALQQSGTTSTLYLNGVADGTATRTPAAASGVVRIGTSKAGANYTTGNVKHVRIDNSALSAADIAKLANNQTITATPVGHWKLDEGSGTTATDSSGNGNHGTLTNGPTYSADIPQWFRPIIESSHAGSFDGVDDYIQSSKLTLTSAVSVSVWVNSSLSTSDRVIVAQTDFTTGDAFVLFWRRNASTDMRFRVGNASTTASATGTVPTTGVWHHLAGTYDGSTVTLYIDGRPVGTASLTGSLYDSANTTLRIGEYGAGASHSSQFGGKIDDLPIYNIALPTAAIADAAAGYLVRAGLVSHYKLDGNANDSHGSNHGTEQGGVGYSTSVPGSL